MSVRNRVRSIAAAAIVISALGGLTTTAASRSTAPAAVATPTVTELTGGVTPGFSRDTDPDGIVLGPDGHIWFTEFCGDGGCSFDELGPGGIGRVNEGGSVTELIGGKAPGFNARSGPDGITSAGGRVWVGECSTPGRLGQVIQGDKVSEMTGGVRTGFAVDSVSCNEGALTTAGNDDVWFTGYSDPGRVSEVINRGTVRALVGGVTPGFSSNRGPTEITHGPNGRVWFTEGNDPGGVGRVNGDGTVTELTGGVTPGFTKNAGPYGITTGPDGHVWFTEQLGGIGRLNGDGTVTELRPGVTPGFSKNARPSHITTGPDGHLWFTEYSSPGRLARINDDGTVSEFAGGATAGFSVAAGPTGLTSGSGSPSTIAAASAR
jgi:virginiamycin B lyase